MKVNGEDLIVGAGMYDQGKTSENYSESLMSIPFRPEKGPH